MVILKGLLENLWRYVARRWGVTVSTQKTKEIAMGEVACDQDMDSMQVDGGETEMVDCFTVHIWVPTY